MCVTQPCVRRRRWLTVRYPPMGGLKPSPRCPAAVSRVCPSPCARPLSSQPLGYRSPEQRRRRCGPRLAGCVLPPQALPACNRSLKRRDLVAPPPRFRPAAAAVRPAAAHREVGVTPPPSLLPRSMDGPLSFAGPSTASSALSYLGLVLVSALGGAAAAVACSSEPGGALQRLLRSLGCSPASTPPPASKQKQQQQESAAATDKQDVLAARVPRVRSSNVLGAAAAWVQCIEALPGCRRLFDAEQLLEGGQGGMADILGDVRGRWLLLGAGLRAGRGAGVPLAGARGWAEEPGALAWLAGHAPPSGHPPPARPIARRPPSLPHAAPTTRPPRAGPHVCRLCGAGPAGGPDRLLRGPAAQVRAGFAAPWAVVLARQAAGEAPPLPHGRRCCPHLAGLQTVGDRARGAGPTSALLTRRRPATAPQALPTHHHHPAAGSMPCSRWAATCAATRAWCTAASPPR